MNTRKYIVQDLKDPNMGTPDFQAMYKKFANRILWIDNNVVEGAFQMNTAWYFAVPERDPHGEDEWLLRIRHDVIGTGRRADQQGHPELFGAGFQGLRQWLRRIGDDIPDHRSGHLVDTDGIGLRGVDAPDRQRRVALREAGGRHAPGRVRRPFEGEGHRDPFGDPLAYSKAPALSLTLKLISESCQGTPISCRRRSKFG